MIHTNLANEAEASVAYDTAGVEEQEQFSLITLRRSGQRALGFRGVVVANGMSFRVGTPFWYELNVFKTSASGYVADVRHFTKADGETDKFSVCVADTMEEVLDFFESYKPSHDVRAEFDLEDDSESASELAFKALALRLKIEEAKSQYESMVSEIFSQLEAEGGDAY
ncbi:MAG: hypothetical protein AAF909_13250 [Pseudomonadota bacterium]